MEVRPGYQQTDAGVLPMDWSSKRIGEFAAVAAGGTPSRSVSRYWNGGIPWITTTQIDANTIMDADQFISTDGLNNSAAKLLAPGTLLMALYGQGKTRGKVAILGVKAATNQACLAISLNKDVFHRYVFHYLVSHYDQIRNFSNTGNQENLNGLIVKSIPIAMPPLPEQENIARALDDVDALIGSLDRLIAKNRDLKQAAMQQLLTGKRRLPGFNGKWEVTPLEEGVSLISGHHVLAHLCNIEGRGFPYLTGPADFPSGVIRQTKFTEHPTTICRKDDILITVKGSGVGSLVIADRSYCISRQLMAIRVKGWDSRFLYYALLQEVHRMESASTGLIPGLSRPDLLNKALLIPDPKEQAAIAEAMFDMAAEVTALEQKRDKTRDLKQGMMQELLTGKTRLI
jgi:type I restriction enzyme, S subunit